MRQFWLGAVGVVMLGIAATTQGAAPATWQSRGVGGGGAFYAPSLSPFALDELYLATDMSSLFHSTDLGQSWSTLDFRNVQGNHGARVQFTSDPKILYVADFSNVADVDVQRPMKSTDGGVTWTALASDPTGGGVFDLWADPTTTNRLVLTDYDSLYFSGDGGATFTKKYTAISSGSGCLAGGAFWDGATIWVATNDGLLVSTDGGATFSISGPSGIPATEAIVSFAGGKQGGTIRFFAVTLDSTNIWNGITGGDHNAYKSVYTLDWGQPAWVRKTTGIQAGDHPFFVGMARGDIATAWLGGGKSGLGAPTLYKTSDGGATWTNTFQAAGNANIVTGWSGSGGDRDWSYGEYVLGLGVSPVDANRVAFTDLGYAHVTANGGQTWKQAYVNPADQNPAGAATPQFRSYHGIGLENTTSWCLTWSDANNLFACFSDIKGTRSTDGGQSWSFDYTGHNANTMYRVVRHANGTLYGGTSSVHDMYQSTTLTDARIDGGSGQVLYSSNLGKTWNVLHNFARPVIWVALDPTNPNRLYAAVVHSLPVPQGGIYVSNDIQNGSTSTWVKLTDPPRTQGHPFNIVVLDDGTLVATFSGRRAGTPINFTDSSGVFTSSNGGTTWSDRSDPAMHWWTKDLAVDPHDPTQSTWYVGVFSGWGGAANNKGGLYRTRDRGLTWSKINNTHSVTSATVSPTSADEMYFTTETHGLWYTSNLNAGSITWTQLNYPFRQPERVFFNPFNPSEVWVSSFGHGLMVGTTAAAPAPTLLRNTMVTAVSPATVPALATFLGLRSPRDDYPPPVLTGGLDQQVNAVTDTTRPLIFYGLDSAQVLKLAKTSVGRVQVNYN